MSTKARQVSGERSRGFRSPEWNATGPPSRDSREAANSNDAAAYKRLTSEDRRAEEESLKDKKANLLLISFVLMLVIGSGNKIFQKLQVRKERLQGELNWGGIVNKGGAEETKGGAEETKG